MAEFTVKENGDAVLEFNVCELMAYADCADVPGRGGPSGLAKFAATIAHMVERKPSNVCISGNGILRQMGLHRFHVKSKSWHDLDYYARDKGEASRMSSHLKGARITQDKAWEQDA